MSDDIESILIVDDDNSFRRSIATTLRRRKYDVLEAADGQSAVEMARAKLPDLVLCDVNMNGMDGFAVLAGLRSQPPTSAIPVVLMTGGLQPRGARYSMEHGADDYLPKPFDTATLLATVGARLERVRAVKRLARENEGRLLEILSATQDLVAIVDSENGRLLYLNRAGRRMLNLKEAEDISQTRLEDFHATQNGGVPIADQIAQARQQGMWVGACAFVARGGCQVPVSKQILAHRLPSGTHGFLSIVARDITDRKQAEEALAQQLQLAALDADIGISLTRQNSLEAILDECARHLVRRLDVAFARIWILNPAENVLELRASAGIYTHLDGPHGRVRMGQFKIGLIAQERKPHLTNQVIGDPRVGDQEWAQREGMVAFAGYPLIVADKLVGVMAMFARHQLPEAILSKLSSAADAIALGIVRKQSEEALHLQTSALEAAANGIVITDRRGKILWVNPAFTQLTGYQASEAIGGTPAVLKSGAHTREFYANIWQTVLAGRVWQGELINRRKDGTVYHEEMTITPVRDGNGELKHFIAVKRNISERKEFEQALARERDLLQALLDNLPDYICFKDTRSRFTRVNTAQARLLGLYNPLQAIGRMDADFIAAGVAGTTLTGESRVLSTGEPMIDTVEQIHSAKGETLWVSSTKVALRDRDGRITGLVGVSRDITQRKNDEERMRAREESFRALANNVPDAVARFDRELRFVYGNPALARAIGLPPSRFVGKTNIELGLPAQEEWNTAIRRVFETGRSETIEFTANSPAGPRNLEARLSPERSASGEVRNVLAVTRDFTAQRQAEKERRMMEVHLRQAQKLEAIGQLAAGIAHEINTPSQYVGDNTRFLRDSFASLVRVCESHKALLQAARTDALTAEQLAEADRLLASEDLDYLLEQIPAAIRETLEGVERVTKIVRAMKEFSHPGGREMSAADLNQAIETTVTVARNEWKYVAEMQLDLDPELPLVPCFVGEFNQVILNLTINAAHAIADVVKEPPGGKGRITIRTRRDGDHVEIRVSDTGTGIPEAIRPKIFEPFFTTKDVGRGTGQGLAIVYGSIVKKHNGSVTFETETGKGTTFIVRLPLAFKPSDPADRRNASGITPQLTSP